MSWRCQPSDFDLPNATPIGAGALSYVLRTVHMETNATVAVKVLSKVQLLQQSKVEAVMMEKDCLYQLGPHPFVARLIGTAQSDDELYFILEHMPHGDLLQHIRTVAAERAKVAALINKGGVDQGPVDANWIPCLDFNDIRLIMAQLVMALSHCFRKGYVLRDLKPENVCFDEAYRCCLIDFDTVAKSEDAVPHTNHGRAVKSKEEEAAAAAQRTQRRSVSEIQGMRRMTSQFCGTAQYVSPEMVGECCWSYSSDLWALGIICYQLLYGTYPFRGANSYTVMKKLIQGMKPEKHFAKEVNLGSMSLSSSPLADGESSSGEDTRSGPPQQDGRNKMSNFERVKSFILALVRIDPTLRLGVDPFSLGYDEKQLRDHPMFDGFDWSVLERQVEEFRFPGPMAYLHQMGQKKTADDAESECVPSSSSPSSSSTTTADSLGPLMHKVPKHSDTYASYVCRASNDVNPFDQWALRVDVEGVPAASQSDDAVVRPPPELDSEDEQILHVNDQRPKHEDPNEQEQDSSSSESESSSDKSDEEEDTSGEEDDVVDDVGVQRVGGTHPDFDYRP